ncbi:hypothetical protein LguiB_026519 [Lonicera macranthoides]
MHLNFIRTLSQGYRCESLLESSKISVPHNSVNVDVGGIIRDSNGKWVIGFVGNIGLVSVFVAKLKAVIFRLRTAWNRRFQKVELELIPLMFGLL